MTHPKAAYELSESQVATPEPVVSVFWRLMRHLRPTLGTVLDMGAGDCRFGKEGTFKRYVGVEIDRGRFNSAVPPRNGVIQLGCVFRHSLGNYDACIGNPPYVRYHDIEAKWRDRTVAQFREHLGISLYKNSNLYLYFISLGILKTHNKGLVGLLVPYEWVSRPSAAPLREYILKQQWNVDIYRFQAPIFDGVLTTASISIVDKGRTQGQWRYYDLTSDYLVVRRKGPAQSSEGVLKYAQRGDVWALRGLSPGSQEVFTLTEGERVRSGLTKHDVVPCVTTLRNVPKRLRVLTNSAFRTHFVRAGRKCWLIRSCSEKRSETLDAYLSAIVPRDRNTKTCKAQRPWFNYRPHPIPRILVGSGFTKFGPKVLLNAVGARAVGSVWGVHSSKREFAARRLQDYLLSINFEKRVVAHAKTLKKVEIGQLNWVLESFSRTERQNARKHSR